MNDGEKFRASPEFIHREVAGESMLILNGKMARQFKGLASSNKTLGSVLTKGLVIRC